MHLVTSTFFAPQKFVCVSVDIFSAAMFTDLFLSVKEKKKLQGVASKNKKVAVRSVATEIYSFQCS